MAGKHSEPLRGLDATQSPLFQGKFGRLFRNLPAAQFGNGEKENKKNLEELGDKMSADFDKPFDGPDPEESGIPSLYTYFGQFVDHDITFDPMSSLMKQADPDALTDFRNPAFDLDNVYGRGPGDQPYMYADKGKFLLGEKLAGGDPNATDLPRNRLDDGTPSGTPGRALIGDPRNDENSIVSQLQGLFLRFHNRLVDDNDSATFEEIQQMLRFHYQYVVLHDFLPRIVSKAVLDELKSDGEYDQSKLKYFHWRHEPFMPVEFSVAAYRLGHSMVRPGYRLNDDDESLLPIFPVPKEGLLEGLTGFRRMITGRGIDWGRFIDIDERHYTGSAANKKKRLQFAYRIDTSLVDPLSALPKSVVDPKDPPASLAQRNLLRGWRLGLPSGQSVARAMGVTPLKDSEIVIGKALDPKDKEPVIPIDQIANGVFTGNCPLWTYVLAEAAHHRTPVKIPVKGHPKPVNTPQLGPVGGRIVAETFLGLMFGDGASMLSRDPHWCPTELIGKQAKPKKDFKLKDFVRYALGGGPPLLMRV